MKETRIVGLFLVFIGALFTPFISEGSQESFSNPALICPAEGKEWVEKCVEQYPEILWLADDNVRKTEEEWAIHKGSYSEMLFGQKYVEFDRTMMTMRCLALILDGGDNAYLEFTAAQPKEIKLSRESFQTLHLEGYRLLSSGWGGMTEQQITRVMETALVLGDIGKSEKARELFKPYGIHAPDHDDFHGDVMQMIEKHPQLCPSFDRLPASGKKLLVKVANLIHYGHVTHLEGGTAMFSKIRESGIPQTDPTALSFDLFVHTCDVAGALGHVNNHSSLAYTELTHRALQATGEAARALSDPLKTEWDAYNTYLGIRASWLSLDMENRFDRVLVRIGAMLRLFTPEEGAVLKESMLSLDAAMLNRIALQLDVQQNDLFSRTPTYVPATLVNLSNNPQLGETKEERLSHAITLGLPFVVRVLEKHKELISNGEFDVNVPLNFIEAAGIAKHSPFCLNNDFSIDNEGGVHVDFQERL